ncbi:phosphatidylserine decarboxylase family protein [Rhodoblastus sp.]|uniref:phosphatidylserine decarboxylase family protein n=1 Tax=Rhodoblastus sp. TaxID=1962975 RepID=UPI0025F43DC5|nr:phosphatidylserine decarboxylase family protein [Rhodoblastus sp.]
MIEEFADLIDDDPIVRMYFTSMIGQVPRTSKFRVRHLDSVEQMLSLMNAVLTYVPEFEDSAYVGCPLDAILDWCMGTPAGFAAFRHPTVNAMVRKIISVWCEYLTSEASLHVINDSPQGWKSEAAQARIGMAQFEHDPNDPHWGFRSWNDFFTRRFRSGVRPVAAPDDGKVTVVPCESRPYRIARNVKRQDDFWIKGQPYSLTDMLAGDPTVDDFVGGVVYQAFLSAFNYHRWHSPVSGTILRTRTVEGTYFSEAESEGEDPIGPNRSQAYLAHVAARAIIHIMADDPSIGHMVVMPIGMGEISSCVIDQSVKAGARVAKGDELGYFQYGGSTVCCLFRPGAIDAFALGAIPELDQAHPPLLRVNSFLARAAD